MKKKGAINKTRTAAGRMELVVNGLTPNSPEARAKEVTIISTNNQLNTNIKLFGILLASVDRYSYVILYKTII